VRDVADLLTDLGSAHLVGHSTGGTAALLAAGRVLRAVRSLIVVEPTVWGITDPDDSPPERPAAYREVWMRGPGLSAREFLVALTEVTGVKDAPGMVSAALAETTEADPADHPDLADMWASGWRQAVAAEHSALAQHINARLVTLSRSAHTPMIEEPDVFNALLWDTWRAACSA